MNEEEEMNAVREIYICSQCDWQFTSLDVKNLPEDLAENFVQTIEENPPLWVECPMCRNRVKTEIVTK